MKKYEIYQLPAENLAKFMNLEFVKEHDIMPKLSDYKKVWEGETEDTGTELDDLFQKFNIGKRPEGYTGHSLSVSDVVKMDGKYYYCDSYGWEQIALTVKQKTVSYNYHDYEETLTTDDVAEMEHDIRIAKLNGRSWEHFIENANRRFDYWHQEAAEMWEQIDAHPVEGMGATMNLWSDRRAMTVTKVISPKKIEVMENDTVCKDWYGSVYEILDTIAEHMGKTIFTLRKNGTWVQEGQPKKFGSVTLTLGFRHHYIDPSF